MSSPPVSSNSNSNSNSSSPTHHVSVPFVDDHPDPDASEDLDGDIRRERLMATLGYLFLHIPILAGALTEATEAGRTFYDLFGVSLSESFESGARYPVESLFAFFGVICLAVIFYFIVQQMDPGYIQPIDRSELQQEKDKEKIIRNSNTGNESELERLTEVATVIPSPRANPTTTTTVSVNPIFVSLKTDLLSSSSSNAAANSSMVLPPASLFGSHPVLSWQYCELCEIVKPDRAKHCHRCERCIQRFDHHCPFMGSCVAQRNHRFFLIYLYLVTTALLWAFFLNLQAFDQELTTLAMYLHGAAGILNFLCFWAGIMLTALHSYLCITNQTTYQMIRVQKQRDRALHPVLTSAAWAAQNIEKPISWDAYHLGYCTNFFQFCFPQFFISSSFAFPAISPRNSFKIVKLSYEEFKKYKENAAKEAEIEKERERERDKEKSTKSEIADSIRIPILAELREPPSSPSSNAVSLSASAALHTVPSLAAFPDAAASIISQNSNSTSSRGGEYGVIEINDEEGDEHEEEDERAAECFPLPPYAFRPQRPQYEMLKRG